MCIIISWSGVTAVLTLSAISMDSRSDLPKVQYATMLYCTVLCCTVLYCTALYCTALYCTVLYCTVLYCTVLYCTILATRSTSLVTSDAGSNANSMSPAPSPTTRLGNPAR